MHISNELQFIELKGHLSFGSPPLYSLLPLWAGDAKEGQCDKT